MLRTDPLCLEPERGPWSNTRGKMSDWFDSFFAFHYVARVQIIMLDKPVATFEVSLLQHQIIMQKGIAHLYRRGLSLILMQTQC